MNGDKNNNSSLTLILIVIIIGLVGYLVYDKIISSTNTPQEENTPNETVDTTTDETPATTTNNEVYNSIIEEYKQALTDENYYDTGKYNNINTNAIHIARDYHNGELYYAYYDINKDNKDELIVGIKKISELYTNDGKRFFNEDCLGERCSAEILDNGTLFFSGSGGARYHTYSFHKIASDGYSSELIKGYNIEYEEGESSYSMNSPTKTITEIKTNQIITDSTVEQLIEEGKGNAQTIDLNTLNWVKIG